MGKENKMIPKKAELYGNPNAKFIRDGDLADILQQFRRLGVSQKQNDFIKYDSATYLSHEVDN